MPRNERRYQRNAPRMLLASALVGVAWQAHALQELEVSDGVTVEAKLSIQEPTRIRIDGSSITNVFGNVHAPGCGNAAATPLAAAPGTAGTTPSEASSMPPASAEVLLECDQDKGEIYVRPLGSQDKPVNLFISSEHATYTLLLRRADIPADTIVLRDKAARLARQGDADSATAAGPSSNHIRRMKGLLVAMATGRVPHDILVTESHQDIQLWTEASLHMLRRFEGRGLIGELYQLHNRSDQDLVLAEQEFFRGNAQITGIAIEHHNLRPGEQTTVFVLRREERP